MNTIDTILGALERAPELVVPLVRSAPRDVVKRRPAPGKWSIHEHACHLAHVHPLFFRRLDQMLAEREPHIESYEPSREDEDGALLNVDLDEALDRFARERQTLVTRLRLLAPEDWERTAQHDEYNHYSLLILFRHVAFHDLFHAYRIEDLVLRKSW